MENFFGQRFRFSTQYHLFVLEILRMNYLKFLVYLSFVALIHNASLSQSFTRADSLRGGLRPQRTCFDVYFYNLELNIDFERKHISGFVDIHFDVVENSGVIQLDLFANMNIDSITHRGKKLSYKREFDAIFVFFGATLAKSNKEIVTVYYNGSPKEAKIPPWDGGFLWRKTLRREEWLGVAVQGIGASLWWPNKDHLSDKPDSVKVTCTYPSHLYFVGNGRKVFDQVDKNKRTTSWKVSYPINNYNVTLNIAPYQFFDEIHSYENGDSLTLEYFVIPQNLNKAKVHFKQVKPMMECFEGYFGAYPFIRDGYKLVETKYPGMEHQSCIAYGNGYKSGYNGMDYSGIGLEFDFIIIHETGHEWWGNAVSVQDLADLWIHEGFCTYSEVLYVECLYGKEIALDYINFAKTRIQNKYPLIPPYGVNAQGPGDIYTKGAMLIHNIRHIVDNDEIFLGWLRAIVDTFSYKTITTKQLIDFTCEYLNQDITVLFNEFLNYANVPVLEYKINNKGNQLYYRWAANQKEFTMPVNVKFQSQKIYPTNKWKSININKLNRNEELFDTRRAYYFLKKL